MFLFSKKYLSAAIVLTITNTPVYAEKEGMEASEQEPAVATDSPIEFWGPRFGGGGFSPTNQRCPYVTGYHGRVGSMIDKLGIHCYGAPSNPAHGGDGGNPVDVSCPSGFVAVGVIGSSGTLIDRFGLLCRNAAGDPWTTYTHGGTGGGSFSWECPWGSVLIGLNLELGIYKKTWRSTPATVVAMVQPVCRVATIP